jgi:hypothetical protein
MYWISIAACFLLFCPSASAEEKNLAGPEITQTLAETTITGVKEGRKWSQTFRKTGVTFYVMGGDTEQGMWKVENNRYCSRWLSHEFWTCYEISKDQDRVTFHPNKGNSWTAQIVR